ncbi:MAG: SIMPL domain-containing protein [Rhodospirillales bacterium]|nr:SIMPL domain-containing protein [Rhodospirillales bacterium]
MSFFRYLIIACFVMVALPVQAAERTINVDGLGKAAAKPDRAEINLSVIANEVTAAKAISTVSEKVTGVLKALAFYGIADDDIQTGSVSLNPVYRRGPNPQDKEPEIIGYRAAIVNTAGVRKIEWLGKILDNLSKAGADRLDGVRFFVADSESLMIEARRKAVAAAMSKAKQLSDAAGVQLGEIISISDASAGGPVGQTRMLAFASAERGVPVMPGDISVQVRVHMVYAIK